MRSLIKTSLFLLLAASSVFAQGGRGTITGTVTDTTGAVIANAKVQAKQIETGALFPTATTSTGNYTLSQLPVGTYEVSVDAPGFKKFVRSGITVAVAQTLRIDIPLEVGAASESVTVSAEASLLKTESGDVSSNVDVSTLDTLPMLGTGSAAAGSSGVRNPNNVLNVVPGVYYVPNSQVKINGAQTNSYAYHVDGMDATNIGLPYAAAETQPSVDAIQEVSVQTSDFAPEYGAVGGGFFNVTMKSGGNQYHGSAYDYYVNEVLNAGEPFSFANPNPTHPDELYRPRARRNDYGFTVGGPVSIPKIYNGKDKTFFFFNFEQFRETQNVLFTDTVPTLAYRSGDFSSAIPAAGNKPLINPQTGQTAGFAGQIFDSSTGVPFANNTIPASRLDPVALRVQSLIPLPTNGGTINNYNTTQPSVRHTTIPAVKIDQLLGSRQKLSFYWSFTHTDSQFSQIYGNYEGFPTPITQARGTFIHSHVERLNYDYTVSPTMLLHVGVGYQQNNFFDDAPVLDFNALATLGLKGPTVNRNFPVFTNLCSPANVCLGAGGSHDLGPPGQTHTYYEKPGGNASLTWVKGSHTVKGGTDIYLSNIPTVPYTNTNGTFLFSPNETTPGPLVGTNFSGGTLGLNYASFLLGAVDQYSIAALADYRMAKKQLGFYLQDSWKVSRKLTLDYGVRYDFGTYYNEEHNRAVNFFPAAPNSFAGGRPGAFLYAGSGPGACNCNFANNYPFALGPRLGAAYSFNEKTVFRAGWGLIYGPTSTNALGINQPGIVNTLTGGSPGQGIPATTLAAGIPVTPVFPSQQVPLNPSGNQALPGGVVFLDPQAGRPPRQNQWSIGVEREFTKDLVLDVNYVGNRGVWWQAPSLVDVNAVTPAVLAAHGINAGDPATRTLLFGGPGVSSLLTTPLSAVNPAIAAQYNLTAPYPGFSGNNTVAQSLRPFPQFANIPVSGDPRGKTWYDSLQAKLVKRFSRNLTFTSTFTWQKSLDVGVDNTIPGSGSTVPNGGSTPTSYVNNTVEAPYASKAISALDQPFVFTIAGYYIVPRLPGLKNNWLEKGAGWLLSDWQVGTLLSYSSGLPIPAPAATTSIANQLFQGSLMDRVPGVPLYTVSDLNCHCYDPAATAVLNPAAWVNPPAGQFGTAAPFYGDYRFQRHPQENINLGRTWRFKERVSLNLRVEFSNFLNRSFYNNPSYTNPTLPVTHNPANAAYLSGGFGYISTVFSQTNQLAQPRNGTIVARVTF